VLHTTDEALTYAAATAVVFKRHSSAPSDSADDEKPLPITVSGAPPSVVPCNGQTDKAAVAGRYVNATLLTENCCPFTDTPMGNTLVVDDGDVAHSTSSRPIRRATVVKALTSKRQRILATLTKVAPNTTNRVPPAAGPAGGATVLSHSAGCT
jgi:hypothetical protein